MHAALAPAVRAAHVDRLILIGDEMRPLAEEVVGTISFDLVSSVDEATQSLMEIVRPGDAVLVKASNSIGLAKLVERMVKGMPCST
jgi:UDP-N-acetylmuramoyl-tripeptide--D-alanyl-D-alanine ligase